MTHVRQNLTENFLYHIWDGQHLLLDQLETTDQQRIEILYRGRWNMDTGPDFKDALIKLDGELKKGDIEIHILDQDWYQHNHHQDERYNNVILHAVLSRLDHSKQIKTKSGTTLPTLVLGDFLDESVSRLQTKIDARPSFSHQKWPEVCLLNPKPALTIRKVLEERGMERLRLKKERFREERDYFQFNELMYQGICEALGYSKNRQPFLKLSFLLPLDEIWRAINQDDDDIALLRLQGIYLGASGLLMHQSSQNNILPEDILQFIQRLKFYWTQFIEEYPITPMSPLKWQFYRLRPLNFPTVRIAGLAMLLLKYRSIGLLDPVLSLFRDLKEKPSKIFSQLQHLFITESYGFWRTHYRLDKTDTIPSKRDYKLIGQNKAREIIINVVLPVIYVYAEESDDFELQSMIKQTYLTAPKLESNYLIRKMTDQLKLKEKKHKITPLGACHQQGMLYLAKRLCPRWHCQECIQSAK